MLHLFLLFSDSTHGTFVNKTRVKPRTYMRIKVGYQLKLGNSTRNYILQGPPEDEDEASELTITEIKAQKAQREAEMKQKVLEEKAEREKKEEEKEAAGISWGMSEDAEDETDLTENPFATTNNEDLFLDDPKKSLRGVFEREGHELEYRCDELSPGVFICRVELPMVDDEYGKNVICEVQHKGKKKECVVQCALEACRILDRHGVLRQANQEPKRAKVANDDDSDDDNFFDRTGDVEKKRLKKLGSAPSEALTYDQLIEQETTLLDKIQTKEHKLQLMVQLEKRQKMQNDEDLDQFMNNLSSMDHKVDKFAISTIKTEIQSMKVEHQKIQKLINIAKPSITLPPIAPLKTKLPLFGKRNSLSRNFGVKRPETVPSLSKVDNSLSDFKEEEDEDDNDGAKDEVKNEVKDSKTSEETKVIETVLVASPIEAVPEMQDSTKNPSNAPAVKTEKASEPSEKLKEPEMKKMKLENLSATSAVEESSASAIKPTISTIEPAKKRKPRNRTNNRLRENIDMNDDDEYIDEEKVSTWVAPEGQSGDGTTHLNQKYGY